MKRINKYSHKCNKFSSNNVNLIYKYDSTSAGGFICRTYCKYIKIFYEFKLYCNYDKIIKLKLLKELL